MRDIDKIIKTAVLSDAESEKKNARDKIRKIAKEAGVELSSLHNLYMAIGRGRVGGFTVPAFNIRTLTYDTACGVFRIAREKSIGAFIFEIAKSEMGYTMQRPDEYASCILAAAIKENYTGPVFIQGDHFQLNKERFEKDSETEIESIKELIRESVGAGFYNIDIDASTLVDLTQNTLI